MRRSSLLPTLATARRVALRSAAIVVLSGVVPAMASSQQRTSAPTSLVFDGVTVVDVEQGKLLPTQRVVIVGNRIQALGDRRAVKLPTGAQVIDARGKYLIPGLWDMHIHPACYPHIFYPLLIANGVTGIREPGSTEPLDSLRRWRHEVALGKRVGPRQVFAGPYLNDFAQGLGALCGDRPVAIVVTTPGEVQDAVDSLKAAGADFIKPHEFAVDSAARRMYFAIAAAARHADIPFGGHIPRSVTPGEASDSGARIIDHSGGWPECVGDSATFDTCAAVAAKLRRNGTWFVPTMTALFLSPLSLRARAAERFWPDSVQRLTGYDHEKRSDSASVGFPNSVPARPDSVPVDRRKELMQRAGMPLLAGTDAAPIFVPTTAPGFSLHDELATLVWAGMTPLGALQAATLNPAKALDALDSLGTVAPGKLADLVLLDADPLTDISNTTAIRAVVANGRYFDRGDLDRLLLEVERQARGGKQP